MQFTQIRGTSRFRRLLSIAGFLAVLLMTATAHRAFAQADQGAIIGTVLDSTGAAIPGAQVTLTETETGLVLTAKTNASGNYFFAPIKTGNYSVRAVAPGFEATMENNIVVHVTDRLNIPLKLTPGKVNETVTVSSVAPLLQTQTAETAVDVSSKFLNDAPLANRNWIFIAQEAPGVTPFVGRGAGNGDFSSDGQDEEQNNYMLDGVDNNTVNSDYINGSSYSLAPPPDAIAEFKMETNDYSAEIGRGHGAVINATTKSGTNSFHGDAWEYVRNTALDALVWNQAPGSVPANFHMNQFGATLGGPILHNHLFFFGDFQDSRFVTAASPTIMSVPTARERQGDFSELLTPDLNNSTCPTVLFVPNQNTGAYKCSGGTVTTPPSGNVQQYNAPGSQQITQGGYTFAAGQNVYSPAQLDPVAINLMKQYPCPNYAPAGTANFGKANGGWSTGNCNSSSDTDTGVTYNNYQVNIPATSDPIQWDGKLDWNISALDLATFRYDYQHIINTNGAPLGPIMDGTNGYGGHNQTYLSENAMFSETHTFSPTLINEFRFGFNFGNDANLQYNYNTPESANLGMGGVPFAGDPQNGGLPSVTISGLQGFGTHGNDPAHEGYDIYEILDNVTKVIGNHSLRFGFEDMPMRFYSTAVPNSRGSYSFNGTYTGVSGQGPTGSGLADFAALGTAPGGGYTNTDNMASGGLSTFTVNNYLHKYFAGYIQDDWKVTHKLTVNLGLRYEYFTPQLEMGDQWANYERLTGAMTPNGPVGSAALVMPISQQSHQLAAGLSAILNADHVQVEYTSNRYISNFPKANWSPRLGASYQVDNKTVARIGAGVFFGAIEPGGGASAIQSAPYLMNGSLQTLPSCTEGSYCESQQAFNNTLEGGLGQIAANGGIGNFTSFPQFMEQDPVVHTPYTINYNLSVQRAITPTTTATVGYVGSQGRHLVTGISPDMAMAITIGGQQGNGLEPAPHLTGAAWETWEAESTYNALQATVQKHYGNGLSFLASYTWAHALDDQVDLLGGNLGGYKQEQLIPMQYERSNSGYDIRHRLVINADYDLPFGVGRQFVNRPGILDKIVGGWKTDMEWWGQTGEPFTVGISHIGGYGNANGGISNNAYKIANPFSNNLQAPNPTSGSSSPLVQSGMTTGTPSNNTANVCAAQTRTRARWFNPCAFADPIGVSTANNATAASLLAPYETGTFSYYSPAVGADSALANGAYNTNGTANANFPNGVPYVTGYAAALPFFGSPKNMVAGPGNWKLNASLFKDFKTFHEQYLEFRADSFNVLNHPSLSGGSGSTNTGSGAQITGPGSTQTNTIDARFFQISGKYVF